MRPGGLSRGLPAAGPGGPGSGCPLGGAAPGRVTPGVAAPGAPEPRPNPAGAGLGPEHGRALRRLDRLLQTCEQCCSGPGQRPACRLRLELEALLDRALRQALEQLAGERPALARPGELTPPKVCRGRPGEGSTWRDDDHA